MPMSFCRFLFEKGYPSTMLSIPMSSSFLDERPSVSFAIDLLTVESEV
jgi:hypothetical protein